MTALFGLIVGLFVTMVLIPPLVRHSGGLRLLDQPDRRKVHDEPIPRVGGIAIFVATLSAIVVWAPLDRTVLGYLAGGGLIALFGFLDDRYQLSYRWKFAGQIAAILVVMLVGVRFEQLPFCGLDPVSAWIAYPISFLFILGVTNALNLADGLDGLAGGSTLLSLAGIGVLAYFAHGPVLTLAAGALIGSILGFLRFNTHPAIVFLGDAGSQFLGFSLATFAILLTTDVNPALNPALPLFLVGVPLLDMISVVLLRLSERRALFQADNRHIHHRLLGLGLSHYEAVSAIYALQAVLVAFAFMARYDSDAMVTAVFLVTAILIFGTLHVAEARGWRAHALTDMGPTSVQASAPVERRNLVLRKFEWLPQASAYFVQLGIAAFLLIGAVFAETPARDIAVVALGIAAMMAFAHFFLNPWTRLFTRVGVYALGLFVVFLLTPMGNTDLDLNWAVNAYLIVLCCMLALAIRVTRRQTFQMTPQDLLMLFLVLSVPNLPLEALSDYPIGTIVLRTGVVFYSCEYVLSRDAVSFRSLRIAAFVSLCVLGLRGLI